MMIIKCQSDSKKKINSSYLLVKYFTIGVETVEFRICY